MQSFEELEEMFGLITNHSMVGISINQNNRIKYANQRFLNYIGYTWEEIKTMNSDELFDLLLYSEDRDRVKEISSKNQMGELKTTTHTELRITRKNGKIAWLEIYAKSIMYQGCPAGMNISIDITKRKNVEQKLKESVENYRRLFNSSKDGIIISSLEGKLISTNPAAAIMLGYENQEEMIGMPILDLYVEPTLREPLIQKLVTIGYLEDFEIQLKKKDGTPIIALLSATIQKDNEGNILQIQVFFKDITERKMAEGELKKFKSIADSANYGIGIINLDGSVVYINNYFASIHGYKPNELIAKDFAIFHSDEQLNRVMELKQKLQYEGSYSAEEVWHKHKYGSKFPMLMNGIIINDEKGDPLFMAATAIDITELKKSDEMLKQSEEHLRRLFETMAEGVVLINPEGIIIQANPAAERILGLKRSDIESRNYVSPQWEIVRLNGTPMPANEMAGPRAMRDKIEVKDIVMGVRRPDETISWINVSAAPILDDVGELYGVVGTFLDITEPKRAEQKLKESEEKYRSLMDGLTQIGIGIDIVKTDYKIVYQNQVLKERFGDIIGKFCYEEYMGLQNPCNYCLMKKAIESKEVQSVELLGKDGKNYELISAPFINPDGSINKVVEVVIDITEHKKAEQKLRESEEKYRILVEQSMQGIIIIQDLKIVFANSAMAEILGYSVEELLSFSSEEVVKFIHPEDRAFVLDRHKDRIEGKSVPNRYEYRIIRKDNEVRTIELYATVIEYEGRIASQQVYMDITERKEVERKLKESEEKFRTIAEQSSIGIGILQDNLIKYVNKGLVDIFGYSIEEMLNWPPNGFAKTIHPNDRETVIEQVKKKQQGLPGYLEQYQFRGITKSGEVLWIDNFTKSIMYEGRPADLVTFVDITEKKKAEQELIKLSKLKSDLLRRTSHELNTPLVSIKGFTNLLLELHKKEFDYKTVSIIEEIKRGCERLEFLVKDLLDTSKLESDQILLNATYEDLAFLIKFCVKELGGLIKERNHTISLEIHENLMTRFEKEKIYDVIINLLGNAIKYTPRHGKIKIKSEIKENFYLISISDNGIGFTVEEKEQIFKQFGKIEHYGQGLDIISEGTGLGLYISRKIIELHEGEIWVESEGKYKGSTFHFTLPIFTKHT